MVYTIKKLARIIALCSFFILFLCGIDLIDPFNLNSIIPAFLKALFGSILLWFTGLVFCDILIKGVVEDIPEENEDVTEGGMLQRIYTNKKENVVKEKSKVSQNAKDKNKDKLKKKRN